MNILVLTSEYPGYFKDPENNITPVVHFFAKEWNDDGHNVLVINNSLRYPMIVHLLPMFVKRIITKKIGFSIMGLDYIREDEYIWDTVPVIRLPIIKFIPHGDHPKYIIEKHVKRIIGYLKEKKFEPDIIIGHWPSPQIQIMNRLKCVYSDCKYALTLHSTRYINSQKFDFKRYMGCLDAIGFRNNADAKKAQTILGLKKKPYVCLSGIPNEYVSEYQMDTTKYNHIDKMKIVYVGRLIDRKNIDITIHALHQSSLKDYEFTIIGTGPSEEKLKQLVEQLQLNDKVFFKGRLPREQVMEYNTNAHVFAMVSKNEAFGLVYLEAMAANCLTIGAYEEGIDGIIENNENGFLCHTDNVKELALIFNHICEMPIEEMKSMAKKAHEKANEMTDSKVADKYLHDVLMSCEKIGEK